MEIPEHRGFNSPPYLKNNEKFLLTILIWYVIINIQGTKHIKGDDKMKTSKKIHKKTIINMNELQLNQRKFTTSEIGRGIGVQKPSKGKGSYTRKEKYKVCY